MRHVYIAFRNVNKDMREKALIPPCEIAVKSIIPSLRALITKMLVEKHGLTQDQAAEILGISQSAVSKYSNKVRGYAAKVADVEEIHPMIDRITTLLLTEKCERTQYMAFFCQICVSVRKSGLMCNFCYDKKPAIEMQECRFCLNPDSNMAEK